MDLDFSVLQEPRGIMRVLHFIFCICAFATTTGYTGEIGSNCNNVKNSLEFSYPFHLEAEATDKCGIIAKGDYSSDAMFYVATGVLSLLYSIAILLVYFKFSEQYKNNARLPLVDFIITIILAVLWLSSSAAWSNGVSGLKETTDPNRIKEAIEVNKDCKDCKVTTSGFSSLHISLVFGYLNFFLWAADIWFVYKETSLFQPRS